MGKTLSVSFRLHRTHHASASKHEGPSVSKAHRTTGSEPRICRNDVAFVGMGLQSFFLVCRKLEARITQFYSLIGILNAKSRSSRNSEYGLQTEFLKNHLFYSWYLKERIGCGGENNSFGCPLETVTLLPAVRKQGLLEDLTGPARGGPHLRKCASLFF